VLNENPNKHIHTYTHRMLTYKIKDTAFSLPVPADDVTFRCKWKGSEDESRLFPCCVYRPNQNISMFHRLAIQVCCDIRLNLQNYESLTRCIRGRNETTFNITLLVLYICTGIIGYGQFVYKLVTVVRGSATVNATYNLNYDWRSANERSQIQLPIQTKFSAFWRQSVAKPKS
jgi:hypothetical protein